MRDDGEGSEEERESGGSTDPTLTADGKPQEGGGPEWGQEEGIASTGERPPQVAKQVAAAERKTERGLRE